jgi:hypothetical protein
MVVLNPMTDKRIRDLERHWKETEAPQAEAAYLMERLRAGHISAETVELAAYCGNRSARAALPEAARAPHDLREWVDGLERWPLAGERAALEACQAAISIALSLAQSGPQPMSLCASEQLFGPSLRAMDATRRWLECPCPTCAQKALEAALAVPSGWSGDPCDNAIAVTHFLGPEREPFLSGRPLTHAPLVVEWSRNREYMRNWFRSSARRQFGWVVTYACLTVEDDVMLRTRIEHALLSWIGLGRSGGTMPTSPPPGLPPAP